MPWLKQVNPIINFVKGTLDIQPDRIKQDVFEAILQKWELRRIETKMRQPTVEEIPNEEQNPYRFTPLDSNSILEQIHDEPSLSAPDETPIPFPEEPIRNMTETIRNDQIEEGDLLMAYIQGESVIRPFSVDPSPLTKEHKNITQTRQSFFRTTRDRHSPRFAQTKDIWIQAKTSISQLKPPHMTKLKKEIY